jgi:hypothetical protein
MCFDDARHTIATNSIERRNPTPAAAARSELQQPGNWAGRLGKRAGKPPAVRVTLRKNRGSARLDLSSPTLG